MNDSLKNPEERQIQIEKLFTLIQGQKAKQSLQKSEEEIDFKQDSYIMKYFEDSETRNKKA